MRISPQPGTVKAYSQRSSLDLGKKHWMLSSMNVMNGCLHTKHACQMVMCVLLLHAELKHHFFCFGHQVLLVYA